jgi:hypothetical protein
METSTTTFEDLVELFHDLIGGGKAEVVLGAARRVPHAAQQLADLLLGVVLLARLRLGHDYDSGPRWESAASPSRAGSSTCVSSPFCPKKPPFALAKTPSTVYSPPETISVRPDRFPIGVERLGHQRADDADTHPARLFVVSEKASCQQSARLQIEAVGRETGRRTRCRFRSPARAP